VPVPVDLFLSIEWLMVAIFTEDHLGQSHRSNNTALLQTLKQGSDDRSKLGFFAPHELVANDLTSEKLRRLVVQHLGDFFSDTSEGFRIGSDFLRLDDLLLDRQILRPVLPTLLLVRTFGDWLKSFALASSLRLSARCHRTKLLLASDEAFK
jgi:hypothetical protein